MKHEILYQPSFSLAVVSLDRGEQILAESGAMVSMSPTIRLEAKMAGGGVFGALKSAVGGESLFRTTFTAETGSGEITLAPSALGDILAIEMTGNKFFVQPGSYLAGDTRLNINVQGSMRGMLSGEGLFLLTVQGSGLLLLSSFGAIHVKHLAPGEEYIVDTGHIVAFEETVDYKLEKATGKTQGVGGFLKGMMQSALSGEGFVCRYRGPGRVYIQTRQFPGFVQQLLPFLPKSNPSGG
ncbi:TIGR00266 family protein [Singulisphaera sp. PoT]|uniref:TIGR00266 family protein n=1 Tax=Singulisphaera sp. PoT TaxID=3411797 RepID=UPI003BF57A72